MESEQKQASLNKWCETSLVSTYVGRKAGEKRCLSRVFQCLLTTALYTNLMLLTVLQVLLSNKTSMNSENTTVEEHSLIELYLLLSRSAGPSCPNFIVVHINPL